FAESTTAMALFGYRRSTNVRRQSYPPVGPLKFPWACLVLCVVLWLLLLIIFSLSSPWESGISFASDHLARNDDKNYRLPSRHGRGWSVQHGLVTTNEEEDEGKEEKEEENVACDRNLYRSNELLRDNQVTLLVNGFSETRIPILRENMRKYSQSAVVRAIYILWGNTSTPTLSISEEMFPSDGAPIRVIRQRSTSLNARFLPRTFIDTAVVVICDDDITIEEAALDLALKIWQDNRDSIVGFFPRSHAYDVELQSWKYVKHPDRYSIMLTKLMLLSTQYLFDYTCSSPRGVREYVEKMVNCEDIAMNFLVSSASKKGPVLVAGSPRDWGDARNSETELSEGALSSRGTHKDNRGKCITEFSRLWGGMKLRYSFAKAIAEVDESSMCSKFGYLINCDTVAMTKLEARRVVGEHVVVKRERYAYATLIGSVELVHAALVLAQSLRSTGTPHHLVLMVDSSGDLQIKGPGRRRRKLSREEKRQRELLKLLRAHYDEVRAIKSVENPYDVDGFNKINAWLLTEYAKVVYIDVDTLVLDNIDELFGRPELTAAPDVYFGTRFNSGLMVIEPSNATYLSLVTSIHKIPSYNRGDQGFLNGFFDGWFEMSIKHRLPFRFNAVLFFPEHYHPPGWYDVNHAAEYLHLGRERAEGGGRGDEGGKGTVGREGVGGSEAPIRVVHFANPWFKPWKPTVNVTGNVWCAAWHQVAEALEQNSWLPLDPDTFSPVLFVPHPQRYPSYHRLMLSRIDPMVTPVFSSSLSSNSSSSSSSFSASTDHSLMSAAVPRHVPAEPPPPMWFTPSKELLVTLVTERTITAAGVWAASYKQHHSFSTFRRIMLIVPSTLRRDIWQPLIPFFNYVRVVPPLKVETQDRSQTRALDLIQMHATGMAKEQDDGRKAQGSRNVGKAAAIREGEGGANTEEIVATGERLANTTIELGEEFLILHLWNLTEWWKVVYVNPLSLFVDNVNSLFDYLPFAATPCVFPPDQFSSRVMVIQPSTDLFHDLLQKATYLPNSRGPNAEGFLNEYFYDWYHRSPKHRISLSFNVNMWFKEGMMKFFTPMKILSFDAEMTPWDGTVQHQSSDRRAAVKLWQRTLCSLEQKARPQIKAVEHLCANLELLQGFQLDRRSRLCNAETAMARLLQVISGQCVTAMHNVDDQGAARDIRPVCYANAEMVSLLQVIPGQSVIA
ncbi:hypothetical protein CBR_g69680, partial [Chara braunii]